MGGITGKDLFALNYLIKKAAQTPGVYLHCFPNYNQAKRAIWKSVHETHDGETIGYLEHIPKELIKHKNSSEMMIQFTNGSVYCLMGLDGKNAARARGMNPSFVILSEYAFMDPESWQTVEPRVKQNNGTVIFISTPNGKNHFYELYNYAIQDPQYFTSLKTCFDAGTLVEEDLEQLRREGVPEDFIQQEYLCSFDRGSIGSYYGALIQKARDEDRICSLPIIPDLPVHTAWDIGIGDSTSIWLFQCNRNNYYNFIEYYENHSEGLEHYIKYLNRFKEKYDIEYGIHFVPHDMKHREFTSGVDRIETARGFGYEMTVVPMKKIEEGIQAVRSILPLCCFDEVRAKAGIKCLDFYRKKYNDTLKTYYDEPLHDRYSHGCFIKGTKVLTNKGKINIESIKVGDLVKTPSGYKTVLNTFIYKASKLLKINTLEGKSIICTPNHKIFTDKKLCHADELCYTDYLIDEKDKICQKYNGYLSKEKCLGFRDFFLLVNAKHSSTLMESAINGMDFTTEQPKEKQIHFLHCIEQFGHIIMDLFLKNIIYTILITTQKTTKLKTWNVCLCSNTCDSVPKITNGSEAKKIKNYVEKIAKNLRNGTQAKKENLGIVNMEKTHGKIENGFLSHVLFAEKKKPLLFSKKIKSVLENVEQKKDLIQTLIMFQENVKYALKNFLSINTRNKKRVREVVDIKLEKEINVYDIEVEQDHCYYANDFLVSNSDAFRMAAIGIKGIGVDKNAPLDTDYEALQKFWG